MAILAAAKIRNPYAGHPRWWACPCTMCARIWRLAAATAAALRATPTATRIAAMTPRRTPPPAPPPPPPRPPTHVEGWTVRPRRASPPAPLEEPRRAPRVPTTRAPRVRVVLREVPEGPGLEAAHSCRASLSFPDYATTGPCGVLEHIWPFGPSADGAWTVDAPESVDTWRAFGEYRRMARRSARPLILGRVAAAREKWGR